MKGANEWSKKGRRDVANWLREVAKDLVKEGDDYAKTFTTTLYAPE